MDYIEEADFEFLDLLISYSDVNAKDNKNGYTALYSAASVESARLVELLLKAGANVNLKDNEGCTVLHQVAGQHTDVSLIKTIKDTKRIITLILDAGADLNEKNNSGYTPLSGASNKSIVAFLKKLGAK